jgi:hypothetical protein
MAPAPYKEWVVDQLKGRAVYNGRPYASRRPQTFVTKLASSAPPERKPRVFQAPEDFIRPVGAPVIQYNDLVAELRVMSDERLDYISFALHPAYRYKNHALIYVRQGESPREGLYPRPGAV